MGRRHLPGLWWNEYHLKYVDVMISPVDYLHRWVESRHKFLKVCRGIMESSTNFLESLIDCKVYAISVLSFKDYIAAFWRDNPQGIISDFPMLSSWVIQRFSYTCVDDRLWTGTDIDVRDPYHQSRDTIGKFKWHA